MNAPNFQETRAFIEAELLAAADDYILERIEKNKTFFESLSARENTVLNMLAKGLTAEEITLIIGCSVNTTRSHLSHIYRKLGVSSSIQAVVIAKRFRLLSD
jgi:DNA-binding CsgD family transcriptional regulator